MSKKKSTITSILTKSVTAIFPAVFFRTGDLPLKSDGNTVTNDEGEPTMPVVSSIKYGRKGFGKGAQADFPCYIVEFEDGLEKLIIPESQVAQLTLAVINKEDEETIPALPND